MSRSAAPTDCLFREDSYLKECAALVVGLTEAGGIVLDRTVFYAASGGQPADPGSLKTASGATIPIAGVVFTDPGKTTIAHVPPPAAPAVAVGDTVKAAIDWRIRHARMRMHTALHLLSAVLPYPVTGGSVGEAESRLDFDIPEAGLDKDAITAKLAEMIATDAGVSSPTAAPIRDAFALAFVRITTIRFSRLGFARSTASRRARPTVRSMPWGFGS